MERWNGAVEWITGLEYWSTGVPERCGERLTARAHTANSSACSSCFTFLVECETDYPLRSWTARAGLGHFLTLL